MQRSEELEGLVREWFAAASAGDGTIVPRRVSSEPGTRLIGSDPDEWLQGGETISSFLQGEVEGAAGRVSFEPAEVEAYQEGDVGWAAARLVLTMPDGGSVRPRWSAVFRKDAGEWQFVQTHASIAIPNDQIGWSYQG